mmetsp:Transcript_9460/g.11702  ORF Transcript_9460/g.11702 Transcript_9460/m.11702 type:complete len:438 (+) Transcript_9460:3-1316(+)
MKFLRITFVEPIVGSISEYVSLRHLGKQTSSSPPWRQWVARIRLSWLSILIEKRLQHLSSVSSFGKETENFHYVQETLQIMKWDTFFEVAGFASTLCIEGTMTLADRLLLEISEEILQEASCKILNPFDDAMWCPLSIALLQNCLKCIAASHFCENKNCLKAKTVMMRTLLQLASDASKTIRDICGQFHSTHAQALRSSLGLLSFHPPYGGMASVVVEDMNNSNNLLDMEKLIYGETKIDIDWYIVQQVIAVVHGLCLTYLKDFSIHNDLYSLSKICSELKMPESIVIKLLITRDPPAPVLRYKNREVKNEIIGSGNVQCKINKIQHKTNDAICRSVNRCQIKVSSHHQKKYLPRIKEKTVNLISCGPDTSLPIGWIVKRFKRMVGKSKGSSDSYWYSPKTRKKFRSKRRVQQFLKVLKENKNFNEDDAMKALGPFR